MVLGYRLIDIRSFWRPNIRIVKIAIRFSTTIKLLFTIIKDIVNVLNDNITLYGKFSNP